MSDLWYYADGSHPEGPFDLAEIRAILLKRTDWQDVLLLGGGASDWRPPGEFEAFEDFGIAPPPIPRRGVNAPLTTPAPDMRPAEATRPAGAVHEPESKAWMAVLGIGGSIFIGLAGLFGFTLAKGMTQVMLTPALTEAQRIRQMLDFAIAHQRGKLPMKLDDITMLTEMSRVDTTLIHWHIVDVDRDDLTDEDFDRLRQKVTKNMCAMKDKYILDRGGKLRYAYADRNARAIGSVSFDKSTCP